MNWGLLYNKLISERCSDTKNAPIGVRTLMECVKDDKPDWFGKYKGYVVYRSKEMV